MLNDHGHGHAILISGGNGYIGSHMCKHLHQLGFEVVWIDNFSSSPAYQTHHYGKFYFSDISNQEKIASIIKQHQVKTVYHFASQAIVIESEKNPFHYYDENVVKSIRFVETCVKNQVANFIFSSTCATYGIPQSQSVRLTEESPQRPYSTYGMTKYLLENFLLDLAKKKLLNLLILRYFNASGASATGEIGENHEPETHLIPNLCLNFFKGGQHPFYLFGKDHPTPDGTCIRDYIHVEDIAVAHYLGLQYLLRNPGAHIYNLGTEKGFSVREILNIFERIVGKKTPVEVMPARPGDPPVLIADMTKAKRDLGFKLQYDLEDCVRHSLNWFRKKFAS